MNNIICIPGPTASGKTALAVELAKKLNGEVVSCDSMYVYKGMNIGTAKPSLEEMDGIVHHMIDVAEPTEDFSVSKYCAMASPIVDNIVARGKTAIITGGTGLYMDSLVKGNDFADFPATGVRQQLEAKAEIVGFEAMLAQLRTVDPESADRLKDTRRVIRALEVYYETGTTITEHNRRTQTLPPRYTPFWLGLDYADRAELYRRINLRVDIMLQQGLLEEIRGLLADGIPEKCTAMQAIGYKEFVSVLKGTCSMEQAVEEVKMGSRRYGKRQLSWFRRNKDIHWLIRQGNETQDEIIAKACKILTDFDN
jgi:tRNA dimethylallyltransferase